MMARWIKPFFVVAGVYDLLLGLAFVFLAPVLFQQFGVEPPNHPGYVQFPALLLILFGVMLLQIAKDPARNRMLIPYAMGLKVAYSGTVLGYWATRGIPFMWIPWAWIDLVFLAVFAMVWARLSRA
jgi:hypothetical protein